MDRLYFPQFLVISLVALCCGAFSPGEMEELNAPKKTTCFHGSNDNMSVYNFSAYDVHKKFKIYLSQYRGKEEPGANGTEILNSLKYVRPGGGFVPNFPLTEKSDVNGENEIPLYTYLKSKCPPPVKTFWSRDCRLTYQPKRSNDIRWNFEKFLIDQNGKPVIRYSQKVQPEVIKDDIYQLLASASSNV